MEARVLWALAAQGAHVPGGLAGVTLLVKAVTRALAREERTDDLPPDMGG